MIVFRKPVPTFRDHALGCAVPIIVNLDVMLARRKMRSKDLAERIGITEQNVSLLKSGKVKGVRFETLERICEALECQPGDILEFRADES
jgi:putative transcriptional regulator